MRLVNRALAFTFALATSAAAQTSVVPIQTKPLDPANLDRSVSACTDFYHFANGGWICPAQAGPLPEPGLTLYGMRALLNSDSALYFKPSQLPEMAPWLLRFWSHCNERDHRHGVEAIARLGRDVFELVDEMDV